VQKKRKKGRNFGKRREKIKVYWVTVVLFLWKTMLKTWKIEKIEYYFREYREE